MVELIIFIILLFGLSMLAIESVESELAIRIKTFFKLTPDNATVCAMSKWGFYKRVLGWGIYPLFPIVILMLLFFKLISFLTKLIDCPYCLSFWYGSLFAFLYLGTDVFISIIIGGLTVLITHIIDKFIIFK